MELQPRLVEVTSPDDPEGIVLVLHGGASRRESMMVSPTQLSVIRMIPIARRVARVGLGRLAVFRLLNSRRGWETTHTPVRDVHWALGQLHDRFSSQIPVCLVGHSLGGRAALLAAGEPVVVSAVALAPWVLPSDAPRGIDGKAILVVHGDRDRIASPGRSAQLARRMSDHARVDYITVRGGKHAMLRRHNEFSGPAAEFARASLLEASARSADLARVGRGTPARG